MKIPTADIRNIRSSLRSIVRAHGFLNSVCQFSGVPHSDIHALIELEENPLRAKELGIILKLEKSSVSRLVGRLVTAGFITQSLSPTDSREQSLSLSSKGAAMVAQTHQRVDALTQSALHFLNEEAAKNISDSLALYARAIGKSVLVSKLKIRKAQKKDDAALCKLVRQGLSDYNALRPGTAGFDPEVEYLSQALNGKKAVYYVAELDGEVVGGAGVGPTPTLPSDTAELKRMFVKKEARGLGVGKALMDSNLGFAKKTGFKKVYLETMEELQTALKFYEKEGFKYLKAPLGSTGHTACQYWMLKKI